MTSRESGSVVAEALELCPIVDGHNDSAWESRIGREYSVEGFDEVLTTDTDIPRLRRGGVGAQFWSVFVVDDDSGPAAVQATLEQIDWVHRLVARYPDDFELARSVADVAHARSLGRIACLLGAEGGHQVNDSPAVLRMLAALGVRYLTLTHYRTSAWADSGTDEAAHGGLNERGRAYVREINRIGMLVDLSHVSPATMHAALDVASAPVIFSHSCARALADNPRNIPDDVLARLAGNGGVAMISFVPQFLREDFWRWHESDRSEPMPRVTIADVADHVEHVRDVAGIRHVGLGSDFDGTDIFPDGLEGVDGYPALLEELASRGWSSGELARLAGGNVLRVLAETDLAFESGRGTHPPALVS